MRAFFSFPRALPVLSSVSPLFTCPFFSLAPPKTDVLVTYMSCGTNEEGRLKQEGERFHVLGYCLSSDNLTNILSAWQWVLSDC